MKFRLVGHILLTASLLHGNAPADDGDSAPAPDARQTAVALNYCRAAFHRIRSQSTADVLGQEQEKILNNINLDGIADREVVQLYSAVLDEINDTGIADYERRLIRSHHSTNMQRRIAWDLLAIGADVATAQYGNAIRTGANSWWDFRTMEYQRDSDLLKVDRKRLDDIITKSSTFLDTFWTMAQKKHIPDRWLVRGDDLDALDSAMRETDPEVRLRVLKRMEPFMEAYPPYWYYLGRTQQELGQLFAASNTYEYLAELGNGHFRKDDMLATGLANRASIQDFLGQPSAVETAERALSYSSDVWEANLVCARILQRHERYEVAEEAILRNLDVDLESSRSHIFLVALYEASQQNEKLRTALSDPETLAALPAPVLLRCAAALGPDATPPIALRRVTASLEGQPRVLFGRDDFVLKADPSWMLHLASIEVSHRGAPLAPPEVTAGNNYYQLRYGGQFEWGNPLTMGTGPDLEFDVRVSYPDGTLIDLDLQPQDANTGAGAPGVAPPVRPVVTRVSGLPPLRIARITIGTRRIATDDLVPVTPVSSTTSTEIPLPPRELPEDVDLN